MQKNLPNPVIKIIESENEDHCFIHVIAYDTKDAIRAECFPESKQYLNEMVGLFTELYARVEIIKLQPPEELFLEEEIILQQVEALHMSRFPESHLICKHQLSNMKIELCEWADGISFEIKPETVEESNKLLRFAANASTKKPDVYYSFRTHEAVCSISFI